MNKNSDPRAEIFSLGVAGGQFPNRNFSKLLELSEMNRVRKLVLGLQVRQDVTSAPAINFIILCFFSEIV